MSLIQTNLSEFMPVLPEIVVTIWALAVLAFDLFVARVNKRKTLGYIAAAGMLAGLVLSLVLAPSAENSQAAGTVLGGMVRNDLYSFVFRIIFYTGGILTCLASMDFKSVRAGGEYYALVMFSALAMSLMAASNDIIMLYLATETASIAQYLMAGFMRGSKLSAEAGIKYFVFGAVISTVMLYGLSLLYGMTGSTSYNAIAQKLGDPVLRIPVIVSTLMVLAGFAFKTSAVPFHFWSPDVYQGAPTPITGFISTASKAAGIAILMRFMESVVLAGSVGADVYVRVLVPISIMTMLLGTFLAISQQNIKRMLAYSSIAQAGYLFIGVASAAAAASAGQRAEAVAAVIFYVATYMLTNIGAFTVAGVVSEKIGSENIKDFAGLARRSPYMALGMVAALLSLLGAPPLVGFTGKFFLFRSAIAVGEGQGINLYIALVAVGVVSVLVSCWYYLGVVKAMYVDRTENDNQPLRVPTASGFVIAVTALGILTLTVLPTRFYDMALAAAKSFLG